MFFTAPLRADTYPFYDRGLSHYAGSADGSDSWVGGQRSEVRVIAGLLPQLKPGGWADEPEWPGEFPQAAIHNPPAIAAVGQRRTTGPTAGRGKFLHGTVTVDFAHNPGTYLSSIWWVRRTTAPSLPGTGGNSNLWNSTTFVSGEPTNDFDIRVANQNPATTSQYWMLAQDSSGKFSAPTPVSV